MNTAVVQPGLVLDTLQRAAASYGLRFGPDPATHSRCTLGGMIGNNSCGSHSVAWGKTVDNVESLDVITYGGALLTAGAAVDLDAGPATFRALAAVRDRWAADVAAGFPQLTRRVSGYNLDQLRPGAHTHLARALVGTEGTCATILAATVALVELPGATALVVLGFPDSYAAAEAADTAVLAALGITAEVLDSDCCGLAGNFGFEDGHYAVSMACAERVLLPAVRGAEPDTVLLADGFSCRTQVRQATAARPQHLAELAATALGLSGWSCPDDANEVR